MKEEITSTYPSETPGVGSACELRATDEDDFGRFYYQLAYMLANLCLPGEKPPKTPTKPCVRYKRVTLDEWTTCVEMSVADLHEGNGGFIGQQVHKGRGPCFARCMRRQCHHLGGVGVVKQQCPVRCSLSVAIAA